MPASISGSSSQNQFKLLYCPLIMGIKGGGEQHVQILSRSESHGYGLPVRQNQKIAHNTGQFFNESMTTYANGIILPINSAKIAKGMSGQSIISIISTNLGPFDVNSVITFGVSFSIRWYTSIFQKLHRFPGN